MRNRPRCRVRGARWTTPALGVKSSGSPVDPDGASASGWARRRSRLLVAVTAALVFVPIALDLVVSGERRAFGYVAADFFYYGVVAEHIAESGLPSFDGERATNGFHPLWQFFLAGARWLTLRLGADRGSLVALSVWSGAALLAVGVTALGAALRRGAAGVSALFVTLPVGVYALVVSPRWWTWDAAEPALDGEGSLPLYGTLWSYANGMESALALCMLGLATWWYARRPALEQRDAAVLGFLLALLVLARLDQAFFPAALLAVMAVRALARRDRRELAHLGWTLATFALPIAVYATLNALAFGSPVPLSGRAKSSFPAPSADNLHSLVTVLTGEGAANPAAVVRCCLLFVPLAVAVSALAWKCAAWLRSGGRVSSGDRRDDVLLALAVNTLAVGLYNLLFVPMLAQGHWYFPLSTLFVSLVVVRALENARPVRWLEATPLRIGGWLGLVALVTGIYFERLQRMSDYHDAYARFFYEEAPRVRAHYERLGFTPRLFECDDGIIAFATGFPTLSATGLTLDREAFERSQAGELGDLALERGYDRMVTLYYGDLSSFEPTQPHIRRLARLLSIRAPERWRFELEYAAPSLRFGIVSVTAAP